MINKVKINELSFRKDLNFLRAVAVIELIIYHFDKNLLVSGWLGVDLFFLYLDI